MVDFNWDKPKPDLISNVEPEEEFDIQPRLLKKRSKKVTKFWVEYDKFTNSVVEITPEYREKTSSLRNSLLVTEDIDLVKKIFTGRVPLGKVSVFFNKEQNRKELTLNRSLFTRSEFDYIFAERADDIGPVHFYCDLVFKKITVTVDYEKLKTYMSDDNLTEVNLERSNMVLNVYCIDTSDPTRLYDSVSLNMFELCNNQFIEKKCFWLPDQLKDFENVGFLHYNSDMPITFSVRKDEVSHDVGRKCSGKPQMVYKQDRNKLLIQSIMENPNNYKINDEITLYFYEKNNPTVLYGYKRISRALLNNFSLVEIELDTDKKVDVVTDHFHIHLEDANVSTDYRI